MLVKLRSALSKLKLTPSKSLILIGVSGGPDSMALSHAMIKLNYKIVVAHYNHMMRSASRADADLVESYANSINATYCYDEGSVIDYAKLNSLSLEEAARELRYKFLFTSAEKYDSPSVMVAHTANDQVETVLMHMIRGAGISGLKGMLNSTTNSEFNGNIQLLRPLLSVWREEIIQYCQNNNLTTIEDETNADQKFLRNRIRHELIPSLETYNPNIKQNIWHMAETLRADEVVILNVVESTLQLLNIHDGEGEGYTSFKLNYFLTLSDGIQRSVIRSKIKELRSHLKNIDFGVIDRAVKFCLTPSKSKKIDLIDGLNMMLEDNVIWIFAQTTILPLDDFPQILNVEPIVNKPSKILMQAEWKMIIEKPNIDTKKFLATTPSDDYSALMDLDQAGHPLMLRTKQAGDRFQPLGMSAGSQKLKDVFINAKIPKRARENWPIVAEGNNIHWIPGCGQSQQLRITEKSSNIIRLRVQKITS